MNILGQNLTNIENNNLDKNSKMKYLQDHNIREIPNLKPNNNNPEQKVTLNPIVNHRNNFSEIDRKSKLIDD